jgi:acyl-CoA synthetase (AMP-forming)/AMP-acid ligase II
VQGPGLLAEYVDDSAATAAALPDGWLRTGDLGLVDHDGTVYFIDRLRDVIRRGGENIASKEVEAVLDAHPDVLRSVVYPVPDPIWVQEVGAVVVPRAGDVRVEDLWRWCEQRLADYKVPRYVDLRPELPTTATGRSTRRGCAPPLSPPRRGIAGPLPPFAATELRDDRWPSAGFRWKQDTSFSSRGPLAT